jgi:hypothetical protein
MKVEPCEFVIRLRAVVGLAAAFSAFGGIDLRGYQAFVFPTILIC